MSFRAKYTNLSDHLFLHELNHMYSISKIKPVFFFSWELSTAYVANR